MKLGIITPVNRYLGFSAPVSPIDQFNEAVKKYSDVQLKFIDPQKSFIKTDGNILPQFFDETGAGIDCDVYFPFGHTLLDRNMVKYIVFALEAAGSKLINGYKALTVSDDKALLALSLSKSGIPVADSTIVSARANVQTIVDTYDGEVLLSKVSGFSAGGVGVKPVLRDVNFLAPEMWMARMDERPRIIQNDLERGKAGTRTVIRAYIVGGHVVGCYTTRGFGVVNCAGLARESVASSYIPTEAEIEVFTSVSEMVGASGYCRIDAVGGDNFAIIEVNPLARMDADVYGIDIAAEIIKLAKTMSGR